jgi:isopentenyl diphosphate isomerase/L-lactate dehydrogenase-like FMN-dependent dehydrogenase
MTFKPSYKSKRQLPDLPFLWSLLELRRPRIRKPSSQVLTVHEFAQLAKRRVPKAVYDYVEGSASDEISYGWTRDALNRVEFNPQTLVDVSQIDTTVEILGKKIDLPIMFAPTGYTRFMHHTGEPAVAEVAAANNLVYGLSTMGTTSPAELGLAVPQARKWFQIYLMRERAATLDVIAQAREGKFEALILTVDTPLAGLRIRDLRNGLTIPPRINWGTLFQVIKKPRWWFNMITTKKLEFAAFRGWNRSLVELAGVIFDPSINTDDIKWLQKQWSGPIIVKGIQSVADAKRVAALGVQGIVVSNHGGRQLDRGTVPIEVLPEIVKAVGKKVDVYLDGGIMSGQDVYAAIAMGAKAVFIGRAYLYGIMADGGRGVNRVIEIMKRDLVTTMGLAGAQTIDDIHKLGAKLRP